MWMNNTYYIEQIAASLEGEAPSVEELQLGLELAVVLATRLETAAVELTVWKPACEAVGVAARVEWLDTLVRCGLAQRCGDTWRLDDSNFRAAVEQQAKAARRWRAHHVACAQAYYRRKSGDARDAALRRSFHLEMAHKFAGAAEALFDAIDDAFIDGDFHVVRRIVSRVDKLLAQVESPAAALVARIEWRRARLSEGSGDYQTALECLAWTMDALADSGHISECGHAYMVRARLLRRMGRLSEAIETFQLAGSHFAICGDEEGLALSRSGKGVALMLDGQTRCARENLLKSMIALETLGMYGTACELRTSIALTWLLEREYVDARRCAQQAMAVAEQNGFVAHEAMAWNILGEVARAEDDYELAVDCFRTSVRLFERTDNINVHISRCNLALVEVALGHYARGQRMLERLVDDFEAAGLESRLAPVHCGLMICAAAKADWEAWRDYRSAVLAWQEQGAGVDADLEWAARLASQSAREKGRCDLADGALELIERVVAE